MKITIHYRPRSETWGGGNQFLKALRQELQDRGMYTDRGGDVVIFNGYQELVALIRSFFMNYKTVRVYRLGPVMSLHRLGLKWKLIDYAMVYIANFCADVVVFQSQWSLMQARRFGFWRRKHVVIIPNAVDDSIFYSLEAHIPHDPIRLVYTSWSTNSNKGFLYLQYLDQHLDFNKYHMTFVGNTPVTFTNIQTIPPLQSSELAAKLRESDVFISPTKDDACSNAILEALSCGLPVVALDSGGNRELVQQGGVLFTDEVTLLAGIDTVSTTISSYRSHINVLSMEAVADRYLEAIRGSIKA